jgi:hypothetical protein
MDEKLNGRGRQAEDTREAAPPTESGELERPAEDFRRKIDCEDRAQYGRRFAATHANRRGRA